ncbi:transposase [Arenimonas sp. MALMAid1274]|uniref:transposase n=1 Tax=Arenimonas sp. MALMAid1274 TaxID=3411630 RepID=UPI003B9F73FA
MPRRPRLLLPGMPLHVIQRGNDRQPCFLDDRDRRRYLDDLRVLARESHCAIHAYVLMGNHVHLLLTPGERGNVSRLMQALGRRYVRWFNDRHARCGTLWQGRFRAGAVDTDDYFFRCHRYIELNPVRSGMAATPALWPWSSYGANAQGAEDALLSPHPMYLALGRDTPSRCAAYAALVDEPLDGDQLQQIREHVHRQQPLGSAGFVARLRDLAAQPA